MSAPALEFAALASIVLAATLMVLRGCLELRQSKRRQARRPQSVYVIGGERRIEQYVRRANGELRPLCGPRLEALERWPWGVVIGEDYGVIQVDKPLFREPELDTSLRGAGR